jgi:hypothetical protein
MTDANTEKARRLALSHIPPGEPLIWWSPMRGRRTGKAASFVFFLLWTAFSLVWTALAFLFTRGDSAADGFAFFPLAGLPFILVGVIGLFTSIRGATGPAAYALTNQRLLVITGKKVEEYTAQHFRHMEIDGSGQRASLGFAHSSIEQGAKPTVWLHNIDDPAAVESLIRKHLRAGA